MILLREAAAYTAALGTLGGIAYWLALPRLKAWLLEEIGKPVKETHHTITTNGGVSTPPTVRDDLSTLAVVVAGNSQRLGLVLHKLEQLDNRLTTHIQKDET